MRTYHLVTEPDDYELSFTVTEVHQGTGATLGIDAVEECTATQDARESLET